MKTYGSVDEYINSFSPEVKEKLLEIRKIIKNLSPDATESISYAMPAYKLKGKPLVYFAAYQNHIGFYPTPNGIENYKKELKSYATGKGTAQFPLQKPLPNKLISEIIKFRIAEIEKTR